MPEKHNSLIRAFFALEVTPEVRASLASFAKSLDKQLTDSRIKWINPNNFHITLRFLGEVDGNCIQAYIDSVDQYLSNLVAFDIRYHNLIVLPPQKPHVIAVSVPLTNVLASIYQGLQQNLSLAGLPKEQRLFLPHLSLARVNRKIILPPETPLILQQVVNGISLMRSELSSAGNKYSSIYTWKLSAHI